MLADPAAAFTKSIELGIDLPPLGGLRSKRYSMVIDDGVVTALNVEPDNTGLSCSLADRLKLKQILEPAMQPEINKLIFHAYYSVHKMKNVGISTK